MCFFFGWDRSSGSPVFVFGYSVTVARDGRNTTWFIVLKIAQDIVPTSILYDLVLHGCKTSTRVGVESLNKLLAQFCQR